MARILNITIGIRSHLNAHLAFIERALELGHECVLCSPSRKIEVEALAASVPFKHLTPAKGKWKPAPYLRGLAVSSAAKLYAKRRADAIMSGLGLREVLQNDKFELVIADAEMHEHILEAYLSGVPTATLDTHLSVQRRPNNPILSDLFVPSDKRLSRVRCWWGWEKSLLRRSIARFARRLLGSGLDEYSVMQRLAERNHQNLAKLVDMRQWPICSFPQLPCLRLTIPEMDFPPAVTNPRHLYIGPMIRPARSRQEDDSLLADIDRFLAARPVDEPRVLVSFGSIVNVPERIATAIKAVESKPVSLLLAIGEARESVGIDTTPDNVFIAKWLPIAHLLPSVNVAICHGGAATIHECIDAGVPMLVYSTGSLDGNGNSARIAGLGLGVQGKNDDSANDMWLHIEYLLQDSKIRSRCAEMRRLFEMYGETSRIEKALSQCIAEPKSD